MRCVVAAVVAVLLLGACAPGVGLEPIDVPEWGRDWPRERAVVSVPTPPEEPPPVTRPVEPVEPIEPVEPPVEPEPPVTPPVEPPVEPGPPPLPPGPPITDADCRIITLPPNAAIERITKCPGRPADLTRR